MTTLPYLETENVLSQYDETKDILFVTYSGVLGSKETIQAYDWIEQFINTPQGTKLFKRIIGVVYDFQNVTEFSMDNLDAVQQKSRELNEKFDFSNIPIALIAANEDHAKALEASIAASPQPGRKKVFMDLEPGIAFLGEFRTGRTTESPRTPPLNTSSVTCYYDEANRQILITYYGNLSGESTEAVYQWVTDYFNEYGINELRGICSDFRLVTRFNRGNSRKTEKLTVNLTKAFDMSNVASAFVVRDYYQEQIVKMGMRSLLRDANKEIFRTYGEAHQFLSDHEHKGNS